MSDPLQAAEHVLSEYDAPNEVDLDDAVVALRNLWTHARTLEAELARKAAETRWGKP